MANTKKEKIPHVIRCEQHLKERAFERFYICIEKVWTMQYPEIYASAIVIYGKRAGIF